MKVSCSMDTIRALRRLITRMPRNELGSTWLGSNDKESFLNSAALGRYVNYARVLSKQNESVMRVHPRMKFEFLFPFFVGDESFLERLG